MNDPISQLVADVQKGPEAAAVVSEELGRRRPGRSEFRQEFTRQALSYGLGIPLLESVLWPRTAGGSQ